MDDVNSPSQRVGHDAAPTRDELTFALEGQRAACVRLGSPLMARLIDCLRLDHLRGGESSLLLAQVGARPVHDAAVLRLLGAIHRLVLMGSEPGLARHYPSAGGTPGSDLEREVLSVLSRRRLDLLADMERPVQTNETGRSVVAMAVLRSLTGLGVNEVLWREIGASAGLNLNFARYRYETEDAVVGPQHSEVAFSREWSCLPGRGEDPIPHVVDARGCDPNPIDATSQEGELRLRSYVWPDDAVRQMRLEQALLVAQRCPPRVDTASADDWLSGVEAPRAAAVVVFHSIVWQYLSPAVQQRVRDTLHGIGRRTTAAPLIWARMEPAGPVADVRLTVWTHGVERSDTLATVGYHGQGYRPLST